MVFATKHEPKRGETVTVELQPLRSPVSGCNTDMELFPPWHGVDTLILESKANSVDICIHINNKIVQYKYKDSVCVFVCAVCMFVCARTVVSGV